MNFKREEKKTAAAAVPTTKKHTYQKSLRLCHIILLHVGRGRKMIPSHGDMPERKQENVKYARNKMKQKSRVCKKERAMKEIEKKEKTTDAPKTSGISHCNS